MLKTIFFKPHNDVSPYLKAYSFKKAKEENGCNVNNIYRWKKREAESPPENEKILSVVIEGQQKDWKVDQDMMQVIEKCKRACRK